MEVLYVLALWTFSVRAENETPLPPLLTFDNGNVGVNFFGFKASAGLGGLLSGDSTQGGLHAEAGTPFGQQAGAGLGGIVSGAKGKTLTAGSLYAGATAGGGVSAAAGLGGATDGTANIGGSGAAASPGTSYVGKVDSKRFSPIYAEQIPVAHKTYVEREVVPRYVERVVEIPSYVEKTVRVPTVVQKTIRVPAPATVIEKGVEVPYTTYVQKTHRRVKPHKTTFRTKVETRSNIGGEVEKTKIVEKTVHHPSRGHVSVKFKGTAPVTTSLGENHGQADVSGGFIAGGRINSGVGTSRRVKTYTSTYKRVHPQVVQDALNIPVQTLGAVSQLLQGLGGGANGSLFVSKEYSHY